MILLYCTDRGQHRRTVLYELDTDDSTDRRVRLKDAGIGGQRDTEAAVPMTVGEVTNDRMAPLDRLTLPCRHCRRSPTWTAARARAIHDQASAGGRVELDLSYLD